MRHVCSIQAICAIHQFFEKQYDAASVDTFHDCGCVHRNAPAGCAPSAPAKRVGDVVAVESVEIVPADAADLKMPSAVEEVSAASKQRANSAIQEADKAIEAAKGSIHAASQSAATEKVLLGESSLTAGVPGSGPITLEQIDSWLANPKTTL